MSDESVVKGEGIGCVGVIICIVIGIALFRSCETRIYFTPVADLYKADGQSKAFTTPYYHEDVGCPRLRIEEPNPSGIIQVVTTGEGEVAGKEKPDLRLKRPKCPLCVK